MAILASTLFCALFFYAQVNGQTCTMGATDVVFVVSEQNSIGANNFKIILNAASDFVDSLTVGTGSGDSRVGFVVYGDAARLGFNLETYTTNSAVKSGITSQTYNAGGINIERGMDMAIRDMFVKEKRQIKVPQIMIIVTNGADQSRVEVEQELAWENDVIVYAIGVGSAVDNDELTKATGDASRVILVNTFSDVSTAMQKICSENGKPTGKVPLSCGCEEENLGTNKYWLDIIFVTDSSSGVIDMDFQAIKNFLLLMTQLNVDQKAGDPQYTRIGIINVASEVQIIANLSTASTGNDLRKLIRSNYKQLGGNKFDVQRGLIAAQDMITEEEEAHRRENVRKAVVLFSTESIDCHKSKSVKSKAGSSNETEIICQLVSVMEGETTTLISVGIKLAGEGEYPYIDIVNKCNALDNTADMITDLLRSLCRANCYCLDEDTQFVASDKSGDNNCEKYGECLRVISFSFPHTTAEMSCTDDNAQLATVTNEAKDEFLKDLHLTAGFWPYWIGLTCNSETDCKYEDGTPLASTDYKNWCSFRNQPDFTKGKCVYEDQCQGFGLAWFSDDCTKLTADHFFSCESAACSVNHYCDYLK